jgi:hypothetical protein
MKKLTLSIAALALAGGLSAQSNQLSFGVDLGLPMGDFGDFASFIVGPSVGFELPVGDNIGITAQVGYDIVSVKSDAQYIKSFSMIPAQAGLKYYFTEQQKGAYGHAQVGIHSSTLKTKDIDLGLFGTIPGTSSSSTSLSWAIGAGYMMEKLDIGLRYNSISPDSDAPDGTNSSTYIGVRVAYLLNLE